LRPPVLQGLLRIVGQFNIKIKIKIEIAISGVIVLREPRRVPRSVSGQSRFLAGFRGDVQNGDTERSELHERLVQVGAEHLADSLLDLAEQIDEVAEVVARLLATPEENVKRFKRGRPTSVAL